MSLVRPLLFSPRSSAAAEMYIKLQAFTSTFATQSSESLYSIPGCDLKAAFFLIATFLQRHYYRAGRTMGMSRNLLDLIMLERLKMVSQKPYTLLLTSSWRQPTNTSFFVIFKVWNHMARNR
jgi:hypothetical protein